LTLTLNLTQAQEAARKLSKEKLLSKMESEKRIKAEWDERVQKRQAEWDEKAMRRRVPSHEGNLSHDSDTAGAATPTGHATPTGKGAASSDVVPAGAAASKVGSGAAQNTRSGSPQHTSPQQGRAASQQQTSLQPTESSTAAASLVL
jgi:hypothetical protein